MGRDTTEPVLLLTDDPELASSLERSLTVRSSPSPLRVFGGSFNPVDECDEEAPTAILVDLDAEDPDPLTVMDLVSGFDARVPRLAIVSNETIPAIPDIVELGIHDWIDRRTLEGDPTAAHIAIRHRIERASRIAAMEVLTDGP